MYIIYNKIKRYYVHEQEEESGTYVIKSKKTIITNNFCFKNDNMIQETGENFGPGQSIMSCLWTW